MEYDRRRSKGKSIWPPWRLLIWAAVCAWAAVTWAADDADRFHVIRPVSPSAPAASAPAGFRDVPEAFENDADRFFRTYMLPGAALLVLVVATTLTAVFYPRSETH